jgi:hypothetical protein
MKSARQRACRQEPHTRQEQTAAIQQVAARRRGHRRFSSSPSKNTSDMAKSRQPFVVAEVIFRSMKAGDG